MHDFSLICWTIREGVVPIEWKTANVIPLPKRNPPVSIDKDIRPISLTPIAAKVFESIVMKWIDAKMDGKIDNKQFGGTSGTSFFWKWLTSGMKRLTIWIHMSALLC